MTRWLSLLAVFLLGAQQEEKITVNYSGLDLEALAQQVERVTKKTFLFQEQLLRGKKVTLRSETPIGPDEFYRVFQTVCHMHGLVLVPVEGEKINLVKIVQTQQAQKEPGIQPILTRGDPLPPGDTLVYYLLAPKHITASKAMSILSSAISSTGVLQQVQGADLILVVDVASAIRRAEKVLALVDTPGSRVVHVSVSLKHVSVSEARAQLEGHLQALEKAATGEAGRGKLVLRSNDRLNTLELYGPEEEVKTAQEYLASLDRELPPARRILQYYRLKNVPAADVADIVKQLLGIAVAAREAESARAEGRPAPSLQGPLAGRPVLETAGRPQAPGAPPAQEPPRAGTERPPHAAPQGSAGPSREEIEIVPIEGLNTLVVVGNQTVHEEVKRILENIDRRKGQVLIEVAIVQITGDDSLDFGIEALQEDRKGGGAIVSGGTGFGLGAQADTNGTGFPDVQNLAAVAGGALRYLKPNDISVLIKAISTKSNVNILSQPLLLVAENESGDFSTKVSEPTIAVSQGTATTISSFAGFAEAVTSLKITPQVSPEGYVTLRITQSFEEFTGQSAAGIPPPKVSNTVTTLITIPDSFTAILGGFTRDSAQESRTGIPILKDVPIIGALTSSTTTKVTKSRLYLFVRPRILTTDGFADLKRVSLEKATDVRIRSRGSRIEGAIDQAFQQGPGPRVKEAPLPFGEKP